MKNLMLSTSTLQNFHLICSCSQTTFTADPVHYSELLFPPFITHFSPTFHHSTDDFLLLATSGCTLGPFSLTVSSHFPKLIPTRTHKCARCCRGSRVVSSAGDCWTVWEAVALLLSVKHCSWQENSASTEFNSCRVLGINRISLWWEWELDSASSEGSFFRKKINALYWMYLFLV